MAERRTRIRELAADGHSTRQIASAIGLTEEGCRHICRDQRIDVPADRVLGNSKRHDANRILEHVVIDAENLTADVKLIDFAAIDRERLGPWIDSLNQSESNLRAFIRQLVKEHQKHVEAA